VTKQAFEFGDASRIDETGVGHDEKERSRVVFSGVSLRFMSVSSAVRRCLILRTLWHGIFARAQWSRVLSQYLFFIPLDEAVIVEVAFLMKG
jgi:hypothetical protein